MVVRTFSNFLVMLTLLGPGSVGQSVKNGAADFQCLKASPRSEWWTEARALIQVSIVG
jgi:hypothetical protein